MKIYIVLFLFLHSVSYADNNSIFYNDSFCTFCIITDTTIINFNDSFDEIQIDYIDFNDSNLFVILNNDFSIRYKMFGLVGGLLTPNYSISRKPYYFRLPNKKINSIFLQIIGQGKATVRIEATNN